MRRIGVEAIRKECTPDKSVYDGVKIWLASAYAEISASAGCRVSLNIEGMARRMSRRFCGKIPYRNAAEATARRFASKIRTAETGIVRFSFSGSTPKRIDSVQRGNRRRKNNHRVCHFCSTTTP